MPRRPRTPSTLKDLIEIRARADGDVIRYKRLLADIRAAVRQAQKDRDAADRMLRRLEKRIPPESIKPIASRTKHARGELTRTLQELLQQAFPDSMSTTELALTVCAVLNLDFATTKERLDWTQDAMARELRTLVRRGLIERLHKKVTAADGRWRWRADADPSLARLREQVEAAGEAVQLTDASHE